MAAVLLALAAGGWWLQRVAFTPSTSREVAHEVLQNADVRQELATVVGSAAAGAVGIPADQLATAIQTTSQNPAAAEFLASIVADSHARLIGSGGPVQITGLQMVEIVRDQRAAEVATITLPVEEVAALDTVRTVLRWLVPIAAVAGIAAAVLGVLTHPERADAFFGIGVFCILAAVLAMLLGYVLPAFAVPAISDNPWIEIVPAAAGAQLATVAGVSCALAAVGVVLVMASTGFRRRTTSWSSPMRGGGRYGGDQRRWS